ncbi:MAG: hypothetical protein LIR50_12255 [Bacillota bacterium]|nr:hypothetical protein [Bacillota bacterium]
MSKKCNCCLSDLLILILIVLQFKPVIGPIGGPGSGPHPDPVPPLAIDNSILFLVALYYLACCKKC